MLKLFVPHLFWRLAVVLCLMGRVWVSAQPIVINEVMYHPLEKAAFTTNGVPLIDLSSDVYEFVELYNYGQTNISLRGWSLSGGIAFKFPTNSVIKAKQYLVVARNPTALLAIKSYKLGSTNLTGPYTGTLGNNGDTVRLRNSDDKIVDSVSYLGGFPWSIGANALGAPDQDFLGINPLAFQYRGRSLERVSTNGHSSDPANWIGSPMVGTNGAPTPGAKNTVTLETPRPVVTQLTVMQDSTRESVIRASQSVRVEVRFSATNFTKPAIEYYLENIDVTNEVSVTNALVVSPSHQEIWTALLPGRTDRSVVRYRVRAERGAGSEVVSPRADDPFKWHSYYVSPVRSTTNAAIYDIFISQTSLARLDVNINQTPRRVDGSGPRASWNATEPAIFVHDGRVYDVRFRFHGSRYRRSAGRQSYKVQFPDYALFKDQESIFITDKQFDNMGGNQLYGLAGLPIISMQWVDLYLNNNASLLRLEQEEYNTKPLKRFHQQQFEMHPGSALEEEGEYYKASGADVDELPYGRSDARRLFKSGKWLPWQRYDYSYALQNHTWKGSLPVMEMIEEMWKARGDSPEAIAPTPNIPKMRAYLEKYFDIDSTLTYLAIRNWSSPWDDFFHNWVLWRRIDGRWCMMPWDLDDEFGVYVSSPFLGIFDGETGNTTSTDAPNYLKDTFLKAYRQEYIEKLYLLNNTVLDPLTIRANGLDIPYRSTQLGALNSIAAFAALRQPSVNAQTQKGPFFKPVTPVNQSPAANSPAAGSPFLEASPFQHDSPIGTGVHQSTLWRIRHASGSYAAPVVNTLSTNQLTRFSIPLNRLKYGETYFWQCVYQDAEKHPSAPSAETSFVYLHPTVSGSVMINEVMANNRSAVANGNDHPDYIELHNPTSQSVNLGGFTLTDDSDDVGRFIFPANTVLPAAGYLVVWADDRFESPGMHTGFGLSAAGQRVLLFNGTNNPALIDHVRFGIQAPDFSVGKIGGELMLNQPTPGAVNRVQLLSSAGSLKMNEWMANPLGGDGWFEVYNSSASPVSLSGLGLSNNPRNPLQHILPALSYIGPREFLRFDAPGEAGNGGLEVPFELTPSSGELVLADAAGAVIDQIYYRPQDLGISEGRLPDGGAAIVKFRDNATPAASNFLPLTQVAINEVLAAPGVGQEQAIELMNLGQTSVSLAGWFLSDDERQLAKFRLPANLPALAPGQFLVLYQESFGKPGASGTFLLNPTEGGRLWVSSSGTDGNLNGFRLNQSYRPSEVGVSQGRHPVVSTGRSPFVALKITTFGNDGAATVAEFRQGLGAVNSGPRVGPVVISEIQYHPITGTGTNASENPLHEFVELVNVGSTEVLLSPSGAGGQPWRFSGGIESDFLPGSSLAPGEVGLLVSFNPSDANARAAFQAKYNMDPSTKLLGQFQGRLANSGEELNLKRSVVTGSPGSDPLRFGLIESVEYGDSAPWPAAADGAGPSLQRLNLRSFGDDPSNWEAAAATPGRVILGGDQDSDGIPDDWEIRYGFDALDGSDAGKDSDGDGLTNLQEFRVGTDPLEIRSTLAFTAILRSGPTVTLRWLGVKEIRYRIESTESLSGTAWMLVQDVVAGADGIVTLQDASLGAATKRFYRLSVP